jgi:hypothetical protein
MHSARHGGSGSDFVQPRQRLLHLRLGFLDGMTAGDRLAPISAADQ